MMLFTLSLAWTNTFGSTRIGLRYFETICYLNILLISVAGISYFATAVTEEKDAGTLALLQLAGLSPFAITLGKSTSRLVSALMLLAVQIPFSFLAVTLGGVLWQQVLAAWVALAAWLILTANAALLASARCATSGRGCHCRLGRRRILRTAGGHSHNHYRDSCSRPAEGPDDGTAKSACSH